MADAYVAEALFHDGTTRRQEVGTAEEAEALYQQWSAEGAKWAGWFAVESM